VSHAVELMVAHVENLRSRHEKNSVVLEEMKKQMEKSCRERHFCEQRGRRTPIRFSHDVKVVIHPLAFKKKCFCVLLQRKLTLLKSWKKTHRRY